MSITRMFSSLGNGIFGFIMKIMIMLLMLVFVLAAVAVLVVNWPFTLGLFTGIFLSEYFYKRINKRFKMRLPKYFYVNIDDFLQTFNDGDEEIQTIRDNMLDKEKRAKSKVESMKEAKKSIKEQYSQIKTKRSVRTLFKKDTASISPRLAKAIESELGKPKWTNHKSRQDDKDDWESLMA